LAFVKNKLVLLDTSTKASCHHAKLYQPPPGNIVAALLGQCAGYHLRTNSTDEAILG